MNTANNSNYELSDVGAKRPNHSQYSWRHVVSVCKFTNIALKITSQQDNIKYCIKNNQPTI